MTLHNYEIAVTWTGNTGAGTKNTRSYSRNHEVAAEGLHPISGSSDPAFRGDQKRWNPEQLFVVSLSQCHMLWYLALAAKAGVNVIAYEDHATGVVVEESNGSGQFESITLHPTVTIDATSDTATAEQLHHKVNEYCFISRSVKTPIDYDITILSKTI